MSKENPSFSQRPQRKPRPLDTQRLRDLALRYVARYATSSAKLRDYLARKLREREWQGDDQPDIDALVGYCVDKGFVDDALYAAQKASDLARRGYGARRVDAMLYMSGIADDDALEARSLTEAAKWKAALLFARRKRIGPFSRSEHGKGPDKDNGDRSVRDRQIAGMLRAGHDMHVACTVIDAPDFAVLREKGDDGLDAALDAMEPLV
jgi:regulatory protein